MQVRKTLRYKVRQLRQALERGETPNTGATFQETLAGMKTCMTRFGTTEDPDGEPVPWHIDTSYNDGERDKFSSQLLALMCFLELPRGPDTDRYVRSLCDYVVGCQQPDGFFPSHNPRSRHQQEGLDTLWAVALLARCGERFDDDRYMETARQAAHAARRHLFHEDAGYVHTHGQTFCCTNATAMAGYALSELYRVTGDKTFLTWAREGIAPVQRMQRDDGSFSYSDHDASIRYSAYHAGIPVYLRWYSRVDDLPWIDPAIEEAVAFQRTLERSDGSIREPELDVYSRVTGVATGLLLESLVGDRRRAKRIAGFLPRFVKDHRRVFTIYRDGKIYHGGRAHIPEATFFTVLRNMLLYERNMEGSKPSQR